MHQRVDDTDGDDSEGVSVMKRLAWIIVPMLVQGVMVGGIALVTFYYGAQHRFALLDKMDEKLTAQIEQEAKDRQRDIALINSVDTSLLAQTQKIMDLVSTCQLTIAKLQARHEVQDAMEGRHK